MVQQFTAAVNRRMIGRRRTKNSKSARVAGLRILRLPGKNPAASV